MLVIHISLGKGVEPLAKLHNGFEVCINMVTFVGTLVQVIYVSTSGVTMTLNVVKFIFVTKFAKLCLVHLKCSLLYLEST